MIKGSEIKKYIKANVPVNVYPAFTTDVKNTSVVYTISTPQGGHVTSDNVELRVIGKDYDEVEDIKQQLIDLFSTEKNGKAVVLDRVAFTGTLSGGGFIYHDDLEMWDITSIFILKTKERNTHGR
ncbi:hypothetical protein TEHN7126_2209 [Tetragenococcus halophilus subsp. halophilus]|uniref:hypothetical protein n=1 Tax=Tetragenococcus halophilus TaxID=51669 RepID=UPI000CABCE9B|nr:hypothetical protein [Tetragenococcus halophilus]GBD74248.1 hypothetical protein TEHN7125_2408 [Tetragenococcus halophilus subsp. halophilus]GBD76510.1 hypothetical protein TEHN7126_2209 [Tetragenococcus halophilus subsp. halophilus]